MIYCPRCNNIFESNQVMSKADIIKLLTDIRFKVFTYHQLAITNPENELINWCDLESYLDTLIQDM